MDGGRPNHEDWISGQASAPARGAPSMEESMRRSVAMRVERARIVEKANVEAGKREIGEARKAKRRASRASRDEKPREDPKLEVLLVGCRGLPKMDMLLGKCDAYVVVAVGDETRKSKTVIRSYNPVFNERLVFSVPPLVDRVALTIYDYDMIGSDELVGNVEEPLVTANARANELLRRDIAHATARRKHGNGCVKFKLRWLEADGAAATPPGAGGAAPNATRRRSFDGAVGGRRGSVGGGRRRSVGGRSLGSLGEAAGAREALPALPNDMLEKFARTKEEQENAAKQAETDLFALANEGSDKREKRIRAARRSKERVETGLDPDAFGDDVVDAIEVKKAKIKAGAAAGWKAARRASAGAILAVTSLAGDIKDAAWKDDPLM
ncbi:orotidine 5'-phosphate decarboxylase [Aureococcus anophagefferens]|nr:orotidine 5'-phosphate decarboxylase [Aureococcus anophagefferens]